MENYTEKNLYTLYDEKTGKVIKRIWDGYTAMETAREYRCAILIEKRKVYNRAE